MTFKDAEKLAERMFAEEQKSGATKGVEYTQGNDRLDNFKRLAKAMNLSPKQVLWVYLQKHLDSIAKYIRNDANTAPGGTQILSEPIEGRIKDARVYLMLLRALIEEENDAIKPEGGKVA